MEIYATITRDQKPATYENHQYTFFKPLIPSPRFPTSSSSPLQTMPLVHHVPGIEDLQKAPYTFEVAPQEYLFNRLQWYYLTCTFTDPMGKPKFIGYPVQFDPEITFIDGRRRTSSPNEIQNSNRVALTITGTCGTSGRELRKCTRCCEKDKARIKRKRKRDTNLSWNQTDEENNSKLIQVLTSGDEKVDSDGKIKFRLRVACCIGVNKQHHMNHYPSNGSNGEREIHRGCEGMGLTVTASGGGLDYCATAVTQPIRILGKVTAADRQKFNDNKEPESPQSTSPPTSGFVTPSRVVPSAEVAISMPEPTYPSTVPRPMPINFPRDVWLYSVVDSDQDPIVTLHEYAMSYKKDLDRIFRMPVRHIFELDFFTQSNLENIAPDLPLMAEIYTTLALGANCKNHGAVEPLMKQAIRVQTTLSQSKLSKEMDIVFFADSLNRTAQYYGAIGDFVNARYYNLQAYTILESLASSGLPDISNDPVYESIIWARVTYNLDLPTLQTGYEWAKARGKLNAMAYTIFLLIITMCNPEMKNHKATAKMRTSIPEKAKHLLLSLYSQLSEVIEVSKYREVKDGRRNYTKLIDNGLAAMKCWITGDIVKAGQHVEATAIQSTLLTHPSLEAFIPTYFGAFVGMQLLSIDQAKFGDVTELLVQSLARMPTFWWARILTDFLIGTLEFYVGSVDIKWVSTSASAGGGSLSAESNANRHLQLLATASGAVFGTNGNTSGGTFATNAGHFPTGGIPQEHSSSLFVNTLQIGHPHLHSQSHPQHVTPHPPQPQSHPQQPLSHQSGDTTGITAV